MKKTHKIYEWRTENFSKLNGLIKIIEMRWNVTPHNK